MGSTLHAWTDMYITKSIKGIAQVANGVYLLGMNNDKNVYFVLT